MPVFNCFLKIMNKNKGMIIMYMAIFIGIAVSISSSNVSKAEKQYSDTALPIAVIDRDGSELSKALAGYLDARHEINVLPDEQEALQDALFYRDVEYILFVPKGFGESFVRDNNSVTLENVKLPDSASGVYLDNQIERYLSTIAVYLDAGLTLKDAVDYTATDLEESTVAEIAVSTEESIPGVAYYFHMIPYVLLAVISSVLGPMLIAFNSTNLLNRTESSALKLRERNAQIALGCILASLLIWAVIIVAAIMIYREEVFTYASALRISNSLVFLAVSVSIGFLIGQLVKNKNALSAVNNVVGLGMCFLCGVFVDQSLMGEGVLAVAKFFPAYWYIVNNDLIASGVNVSRMAAYGEGILIQLGFAAAIFAVALVVSRQKKLSPST